MKIAPLKMNDPWFARIMNDATIPAESLKNVPIESTVEMELVELLHGGPESNYRPYLHLRGELTEAKPSVELPYGITEFALRRGAGLSVDAFYDFNPRQLGELVSKGYFTDQFKVPDEMSGIPWTLPGTADFFVVAPEYSDQPPVVFMHTHDRSELELDEANSGYDLATYFPDYVPQAEAENQLVPDAAPVSSDPERIDFGFDVFSGEVFDESRTGQFDDQRRTPTTDDRELVPTGVFSRLVSEIEAQHAIESDFEVETVLENVPDVIVPGSFMDVYLSRVSPGVNRVLSGRHAGEPIMAHLTPTPAPVEVPVEVSASVPGPYDFDDVIPSEADAEALFFDGADVPRDDEPVMSATIPIEVPRYESDSVSGGMGEGFLDLSEPEPELTPPPVTTVAAREDDGDGHRRVAERRAARIRSELAAENVEADEASPFEDVVHQGV